MLPLFTPLPSLGTLALQTVHIPSPWESWFDQSQVVNEQPAEFRVLPLSPRTLLGDRALSNGETMCGSWGGRRIPPRALWAEELFAPLMGSLQWGPPGPHSCPTAPPGSGWGIGLKKWTGHGLLSPQSMGVLKSVA